MITQAVTTTTPTDDEGDDHAHGGDDDPTKATTRTATIMPTGTIMSMAASIRTSGSIRRTARRWRATSPTVLSAADPANAQTYKDNAEAMAGELDALASDLAARLDPVKDRPFLVFHDAYQYLEARSTSTAWAPSCSIRRPHPAPGVFRRSASASTRQA
jgi:ABC-type Zn2+ transport system substrate-binding protein/surface adhesin